MKRYTIWFVLLMCALCMPGMAAQEATLAPATKEIVPSGEGTFLLWHRTPAVAADLGMPIYRQGLIMESQAYRVRDRKNRNVLRYARVRLTTAQAVDTLAAYYTKALGTDAQRETDKDTGEVTLTTGTRDNFRLVIITPGTGYSQVKLERVQRYTIPERRYDEREQRVMRVLDEITRTYSTATHVSYTLSHRVKPLEADSPTHPSPILTWTVDYTRPDKLHVTAKVDKTLGLDITTRDGALIVTRPGSKEECRALNGPISIEDVPELEDDPVARMMLGDTLMTPLVDYLALQAVPGVPTNQQADMVLTYPETYATVHLLLDLQQKTILSTAVTVTPHDDEKKLVTRTYANFTLEPARENTVDDTASQQQPAPTVPAAVPSP